MQSGDVDGVVRVTSSLTADQIRAALAKAFPGTAVVCEEVGLELDSGRSRRLALTTPLSEREEQIVTRIADGWLNQNIADELYLSVNSVKTYIRSAYAKMGVKTRSQAVAWYFRRAADLGAEREVLTDPSEKSA